MLHGGPQWSGAGVAGVEWREETPRGVGRAPRGRFSGTTFDCDHRQTDRQTDRQWSPRTIYIYIYRAPVQNLHGRVRKRDRASRRPTYRRLRRSARHRSTFSTVDAYKQYIIDRRAKKERRCESSSALRPPPPTPTRSEQATLTRCTVRTLTQPVLWCVRLKRELAPAGGSLKEPPGGGWGESPRPGGKTGGALKAPPGLRPGRGRCGDRRERAHPPPSWPT